MEQKPTYIDLFAGCGGLSLGLYNAGWKGIFAIEKSKDAFETLKYNLIENRNHFDWPCWIDPTPHDINEVLQKHEKELIGLRGKVDMVTGGPPCQGFSSAGKRQEDDFRNSLIKSYIKFIRLVQPKIVFFENVKGFTQKFKKNKTIGKNYSEYVKNSLTRSGIDYTGYKVMGALINFSEFGIPQKRTRFILVGVRKDICASNRVKANTFFKNLISNRKEFLVNKGLSLNATLEDAISDLLLNNGFVKSPDSPGFMAGVYSSPKSKYQFYLRGDKNLTKTIADSHRFANHNNNTLTLFKDLLEHVEKGKRIPDLIKDEFNVKKRGLIVLDSKLAAPTLTSHPDDYIHYSEPRILTVREYARIQSFPDWYEMRGKYTTGGILRKKEVPRYTQLGNAIPPLFGELSGLILKQIITPNE